MFHVKQPWLLTSTVVLIYIWASCRSMHRSSDDIGSGNPQGSTVPAREREAPRGPAETSLASTVVLLLPIHGGSGFRAIPRSPSEIPGLPESPIFAGNACIQSGLRVCRGGSAKCGKCANPEAGFLLGCRPESCRARLVDAASVLCDRNGIVAFGHRRAHQTVAHVAQHARGIAGARIAEAAAAR